MAVTPTASSLTVSTTTSMTPAATLAITAPLDHANDQTLSVRFAAFGSVGHDSLNERNLRRKGVDRMLFVLELEAEPNTTGL